MKKWVPTPGVSHPRGVPHPRRVLVFAPRVEGCWLVNDTGGPFFFFGVETTNADAPEFFQIFACYFSGIVTIEHSGISTCSGLVLHADDLRGEIRVFLELTIRFSKAYVQTREPSPKAYPPPPYVATVWRHLS